MLKRLTCADFEPLVGETFLVTPASREPVAVALLEATGVGAGREPPEGHRAPFALLFRGPERPLLSQGTYPIEHAGLGRLDLFLVPVGPDARGMRYEAVFN